MDYKPADIEAKWRKYWEEHQVYKVSNESDKPKYYVLDMFPYPSGSGLHVGHPLGYIASDIYARYKRLNGFNVLHPMGYDAFGLPAEQYAVTVGVHPAVSTDENIKRFRQQMDNIGFSFDWSRQVKTSDPKYYKWTQWIFLELYGHFYDTEAQKARPIATLEAHFEEKGNDCLNAASSIDFTFSAEEWKAMNKKQRSDILMNYRLAYRKVGVVNWCEELGTVLANDEVKDGVSERGGYPVIQKPILQWSLRTSAYAERLLEGLDKVDFSESLKTQQRNWIGKSQGASMTFQVADGTQQIEVFTTRPDTVFGATYMVLAPEHDFVAELTTAEQKEKIADYLAYVKSRSERDRQADVKTVTGEFTGSYAINPFTQEQIPIWIAEYVLAGYGTGAIMAVPSDDERDQRFANKFGIPIVEVVDKSDYPGSTLADKEGKMINSGFLTGMEVPEAIAVAIAKIEEMNIGKGKINYRLRDANYSRQRYWGEPIPIVYDKDGVEHPLKTSELPLILPKLDDFKPTADGKAPLARKTDWVNLPNGMTRETDTMPGFAGSSWYFLRYMDPENEDSFVGKNAVDYWQDVDLYVGGSEHAVGHLMYSRFWHKFLYDKGLVPTEEPYKKLVNQGMIQGVIEYMYMAKDKIDGKSHFMCARKVASQDNEKFTRIPVNVNFIQEYGSKDSFLNITSIKQFIDWRPEYANAVFECGGGTYQNGVFTASSTATDVHLFTESEVGKMGKRYYNAVNPDDVVSYYGTDCFRLYEMFLGPLEQAKPWDTKGIEGVSKFLKKLFFLYFNDNGLNVSDAKASKEEMKVLHTAIKKVQTDIERLSFNTCVSAFMVCVNDLRKLKCNKREVLQDLAVLVAPFAPHLAEEFWHQLGNKGSVQKANYPKLEESYLKEDMITYPISINGKKRATATFAADASKQDIEAEAKELDSIQKWLEGKSIRKVIVVPKRMVNIVIG